MGAEDFAEYTAKAKASFVGLGGGGTYPQHSDYFCIEEESFKNGVAWYIQVACDCLEGKAK
jgi:metal-dependent amidase/aminoacylase/carboxypeptidase family protein